MDVYGSDTAPDEEATGNGADTTPEVGSWFQRGSTNESALSDRGIAVPVNAMLDRVREADALIFENEDSEL
jgi:predicted RNase H-like nuclease